MPVRKCAGIKERLYHIAESYGHMRTVDSFDYTISERFMCNSSSGNGPLRSFCSWRLSGRDRLREYTILKDARIRKRSFCLSKPNLDNILCDRKNNSSPVAIVVYSHTGLYPRQIAQLTLKLRLSAPLFLSLFALFLTLFCSFLISPAFCGFPFSLFLTFPLGFFTFSSKFCLFCPLFSLFAPFFSFSCCSSFFNLSTLSLFFLSLLLFQNLYLFVTSSNGSLEEGNEFLPFNLRIFIPFSRPNPVKVPAHILEDRTSKPVAISGCSCRDIRIAITFNACNKLFYQIGRMFYSNINLIS